MEYLGKRPEYEVYKRKECGNYTKLDFVFSERKDAEKFCESEREEHVITLTWAEWFSAFNQEEIPQNLKKWQEAEKDVEEASKKGVQAESKESQKSNYLGGVTESNESKYQKIVKSANAQYELFPRGNPWGNK